MRLRKLHQREQRRNQRSPRRFPRGSGRAVVTVTAIFVLVLGLMGISYAPFVQMDVRTSESHGPAEGQSPQLKAAAPSYPISGFFISASSRDSINVRKLTDIKAFGGDTVITFGTSLQPATLESLPSDCVVDGKNCARVAAASGTVDRYFTFLDGSNWDENARKCPNDLKVTNNGQSYTVLVLPDSGDGCVSPNGRYDVVVVGGSSSSATDPSRSLAAAATKLGLKYFAGMPAPVKRTDQAYLPDMSYEGTLAKFTERFLEYQAAVNDVPGLAGFYHHTEMPLTDSEGFDPILDLYASQNRAIRSIFPTRQAIVSPYIDARIANAGISPEKAKNGIRKIAHTSGGLVLNIAIQDGMGTGKGGAFNGSEANSPVDPFAATIVGKGQWGTKYIAPNRDYFSAAAAGISGTGAVLWANVEGMAPATNANTCGDSLRGQTTKSRLDRQLQQVAIAKKVVSFMWDSYFTCIGTGEPLQKQVEADLTTPIVTDTTFRPSTGQVDIVGFNLMGSTATVNWTSEKGQQLEKSVRASRLDSTYGVRNGMNPKLEMVTVNVGATTANTSKNYAINLTNGWGKKATEVQSQLR